jgi:hypothetical protein
MTPTTPPPDGPLMVTPEFPRPTELEVVTDPPPAAVMPDTTHHAQVPDPLVNVTVAVPDATDELTPTTTGFVADVPVKLGVFVIVVFAEKNTPVPAATWRVAITGLPLIETGEKPEPEYVIETMLKDLPPVLKLRLLPEPENNRVELSGVTVRLVPVPVSHSEFDPLSVHVPLPIIITRVFELLLENPGMFTAKSLASNVPFVTVTILRVVSAS